MGKQSAPAPPNLQPVSSAQIQIAQMQQQTAQQYLGLSQQQFSFLQQNAKQELTFAQQQADRSFGLQQSALDTQKGIEAAAQNVSNAQLQAMQTAEGYAAQDRARYESTFVPLQDQMVQFAKNYASPGMQELQAGKAIGDVAQSADLARQNANARLTSMGVDPSQVQSASLLNQMGVGTAAAEAQAGNQARINTQLTGQQLLGNAVNMGAGIPSQINASMNTGTNSGNSAVSAAGAGQSGALNAMGQSIQYGGSGLGELTGALQSYGNLTGSPMQWAGLSNNLSNSAQSGYNSAAGTMMSQFNAGLNAASMNNQTTSSEIGNVMGGAAMLAMAAGGGLVGDPNVGNYFAPNTQGTPVDYLNQGSGGAQPLFDPATSDQQARGHIAALQKLGVPKSIASNSNWRANLMKGLKAAQAMRGAIKSPNYPTYDDSVQGGQAPAMMDVGSMGSGPPSAAMFAAGGAIPTATSGDFNGTMGALRYNPQQVFHGADPVFTPPAAPAQAPSYNPQQVFHGRDPVFTPPATQAPAPNAGGSAFHPYSQMQTFQGHDPAFNAPTAAIPTAAYPGFGGNGGMGGGHGGFGGNDGFGGNGFGNLRGGFQGNGDQRFMYRAGGGPIEPVGQQAADLEDRPLEWNRMFPQYSASGGPVPGQQSVDKVHAMLSGGEYVIPRDVVASKGIEFFDRLVKKYHRPGA